MQSDRYAYVIIIVCPDHSLGAMQWGGNLIVFGQAPLCLTSTLVQLYYRPNPVSDFEARVSHSATAGWPPTLGRKLSCVSNIIIHTTTYL